MLRINKNNKNINLKENKKFKSSFVDYWYINDKDYESIQNIMDKVSKSEFGSRKYLDDKDKYSNIEKVWASVLFGNFKE